MSSLYLHIPFCSKKCPYCDFFSQVGQQQQLDEYVELLRRDILIVKKGHPQNPPFATIYFGGGTPSLLSAKQINLLLTDINGTFGIEPEAEITLEANPGTLQLEQLIAYRQAGVNRLSLGIQSLNDQKLQLLGRIHIAEQARKSVAMSRKAGFHNLSLDLMFALPGQSLQALEQELSQLLGLEPEHISIYGLTFEDGTEFARRLKSGDISSCEEGLYAEQYHLVHETLIKAGYEHYEISNFARPGFRCRHNQTYWQRTTCLAVGAGSHQFIDQTWGERWQVPPDLARYKELLRKNINPSQLLETFDQQGAMKECLYLALRTSDGLDLPYFEQRFGFRAEDLFTQAFRKAQPYLKSDDQRWYFDLEGWLLYDHLISHFL
ncbi:MAG: radical SAM family heme chaperone HemW [Deltaproteobacteria bacterium]|jgi:oxygen-independent coproporphyrinogen-3 oxidase|nr:radical SAM family heme chaperone HemW [Deltaproteobacteria bacterium]